MRKLAGIFVALTALVVFTAGGTVVSSAAGWSKKAGSWMYYGEDGNALADQWKKDGGHWYWFDSDGRMAADTLVAFGENYYYMGEDGAMVTGRWVEIQNTDDEASDPEADAPESWWYYFQSSGKAYKAPDSGRTSFEKIDGKRYAFDENGRMLYGWVDENSARRTEDDAWLDCPYYLGGEDDGVLRTGWAQIPVVDENTARWDETGDESEEQEYWFYFGPSGRKVRSEGEDKPLKLKRINGSRYAFDSTGRMAFEWTDMNIRAASASTPSHSKTNASSSVADYGYFGSRADGARVNDGWFKVVPGYGGNAEDYEEEEAGWYYAEDGRICASEFKNIDGRKYCFDNSGRMLTGLQAVYTDGAGRVWNRKLDTAELLTGAISLQESESTQLYLVDENGRESGGTITYREAAGYAYRGEDPYSGSGEIAPSYGVYYFGDEEDGAARTAKQRIRVEKETWDFFFYGNGSDKGKGFNGKKGEHFYREGCMVKADKEYRTYEAYAITAKPWQKNADGTPVEADSKVYQDTYRHLIENDSGEGAYFLPGYVYRVNLDSIYLLYIYVHYYDCEIEDKVRLIDTKGSIIKGTRHLEDGDGGFQIYEDEVVLYAWKR